MIGVGPSGQSKRRYLQAAICGLLVEGVLATVVMAAPARSELSTKAPSRSRVVVVNRSVSLSKPSPQIEGEQPVPVPTVLAPEVIDTPAPSPAAKEVQRSQRAPKRPKVKRAPRPRKTVRKAPKVSSKPAPRTLALDSLGTTSHIVVRESDGSGDRLGDPSIGPAESAVDNDAVVSSTDNVTALGQGGENGTDARGSRQEKVTPPRVKKRVQGVYPKSAPKLGRRIPVTLSLQIDVAGRVASARVVARPVAAGTAFDRAALQAVQKTRFYPAQRGGKPVPFRIRWTVFFEPP